MVIKRIVAYFIDILLITFAASMLASISYLNPQLESYTKVYNEFIEFEDQIKENNNYLEVAKENTEKLNDINYRLDKNNIYGTIISIALTIIYFVFFQKYNGGQTLGKKIMGIKISEDLSLSKYLLRTLILHNTFINALKLILVLTISKSKYIMANNIILVIAFIVETTIIVMVALRKDNRGLHDIIVGSTVEELPKVVKKD